jgi:hypothetical protein
MKDMNRKCPDMKISNRNYLHMQFVIWPSTGANWGQQVPLPGVNMWHPAEVIIGLVFVPMKDQIFEVVPHPPVFIGSSTSWHFGWSTFTINKAINTVFSGPEIAG